MHTRPEKENATPRVPDNGMEMLDAPAALDGRIYYDHIPQRNELVERHMPAPLCSSTTLALVPLLHEFL